MYKILQNFTMENAEEKLFEFWTLNHFNFNFKQIKSKIQVWSGGFDASKNIEMYVHTQMNAC